MIFCSSDKSISFLLLQSAGNMLEGYALPQISVQYDIYGRKREQYRVLRVFTFNV